MKEPAEVFSVGEFLQDELDARGWSKEDLLNRMPGNRSENDLWIDLVLSAKDMDLDIRQSLRLGDPSALAHALGVSNEFLTNIDEAWVKHQNRAMP